MLEVRSGNFSERQSDHSAAFSITVDLVDRDHHSDTVVLEIQGQPALGALSSLEHPRSMLVSSPTAPIFPLAVSSYIDNV